MNLLVIYNYLHQFIDIDLYHSDSAINYLAFYVLELCKYAEDKGIILPRYYLYDDNTIITHYL